jgi:hypothetical protein
MKNQSINYFNLKTILFISLFLICSCFVNAQIKIDADGRVALHSTTTSTACNIWLHGLTILQNDYDGRMIFGNDYSNPEFYPGTNNTGKIGKLNYQFQYIYGYAIYGNGTYLGSDKRIKENFRSIDQPLSKILQMNGQKYDFISEASDTIGTEKEKQKRAAMKKNRLGFIAQDLEKIVPEAVLYEEDADKYYIEYSAIIPVIVEAMKEQQTTIEKLNARIETLEGNSAKEKSATIDGTTPASLNQNIPNPFSENTTINMYIPNTVSRATLYIYNMQGEQIKYIAVNERGKTSVTIEGRTLKAGMYLYTLITDGKEVDTKKMILTK